ncbi:inorganic triphosphatase [Neptunomonas qingdaonensis]|uniref:CYTH domain-containing protein n=1 Tax=Neptunomonas qingdaonensis TaxID=1045558 RepID=A0A1I2M4U6_9GAMM|nr:CYTH domain-containing protein [Neptunomonas qingdaonensis]SFF84406.1 CYTH domain-containing protein [Neptunomonas qingdaonensis]
MALETEIKLLVPKDVIARVTQLPALLAAKAYQTQNLRNWYFDTPELRLSADKVALRIREQSGTYIQTFKTKGNSVNGLHQRGEWEWLIDKPELDISLLVEADYPPAKQGVDWAAELEVIFATNFARTVWIIEWPESDTVIEVALDQGEVSYTSLQGQTYADDICELELELKSGKVEDLMAASAMFTIAIPELTPSNISKAERGYQLFHLAQECRIND